MNLQTWFWCLVSLPAFVSVNAVAADFDTLAKEYHKAVKPILKRYCLGCHDTETKKGELDLERFAGLAEVRTKPKVWQQVLRQIESGEMPPEKKKQPSTNERKALTGWMKRYLQAEALASAGDPGPVVIRRLSNAEYTYTIRDLTGINSLDPAREFPVDGAAGEGFTNTGAALVMSPALLTKYLDAAKQVAGHAVLLPDGIAFSERTTRRDWTEEKLAAIRKFYDRFSLPGNIAAHNLQGIKFKTRDGGVIPLQRYLRATLTDRKKLSSGEKDLATVARENRLSPKYFASLWQTLNDRKPSLLLDRIRSQWHAAKPQDAGSIAKTIVGWQHALWHFTKVGHIGKRDGPKAWQVPVKPLVSRQEVRFKFPKSAKGDVLTLFLTAGDAGKTSGLDAPRQEDSGLDAPRQEGSGLDAPRQEGKSYEQDVILWKQARLVMPAGPSIPLRDIESLVAQAVALQEKELPRTAAYLDAVVESHATKQPIEKVAAKHGLSPVLAASWSAFVQLGKSDVPKPTGHFAGKLSNVGGYASLRGWGFHKTPMLLTNQSEADIRYLTLTVPARGVTVHPSPAKDAILFWQSPIEGTVLIKGLVADADDKCGNGAVWQVDLITRLGTQKLADGVFNNGGRKQFGPSKALAVRKGDLIKLTVNARNRNHACDTTHVELSITEPGENGRVWDLANDVVDRIHDSNPMADSEGNPGVWHFCASDAKSPDGPTIPVDSALAIWRAAVMDGKPIEIEIAAEEVQDRLTKKSRRPARKNPGLPDPGSGPDENVKTLVLDWRGPFRWLAKPGRPADIEQSAPSVLKFRIPAGLAAGAEFVATAVLHPDKGKEGSVQVQASMTRPRTPLALTPGTLKAIGGKRKWTDGAVPVVSDLPILVRVNSEARKRIVRDIEAFQQLFPAALCYTRIVPVDEVVTLTLFHREDDHLRRLMLDRDEVAEIDRLWQELHFVSLDAFQLVDAFEQLWQYATQDADPSAFEPLRKPIQQRAARFREKLTDAEPRHLDSVLEFAARAWRGPLSEAEQKQLRSLYAQLRAQELKHDAAIRLTLARVLVAPEFLYKAEKPATGPKPAPVSDTELATRLSYFLWSSTPDAELMRLASENRLGDPDQITSQARRILGDERVSRLALEFACQWLGIRHFDQLDEKSERHFPKFAELRGQMREEAIRFFTDLFQNDGSILSLLDADHTFADSRLATFYGFKNSPPKGWQRIDGIRKHGRGGILGMAATLAKQSGASRTSPILRGNWIYETLLGKHLPKPPKDVPQLPDSVPEGLTARQLTERHRAEPACAKCHARIDPYGFALEDFDAIGRARTGANTKTTLPGGQEIEGLNGLRSYLLKERREEFVRQFCRKLLGYALGRSVQLSDEPLLDEMLSKLAKENYRVQLAIDMIVQSRQFRDIRGRADNN